MFTNVCFLKKKNKNLWSFNLTPFYLFTTAKYIISMLWHPEDIITTIILKNQYIYPFLFSSYIYPFLLFFFFLPTVLRIFENLWCSFTDSRNSSRINSSRINTKKTTLRNFIVKPQKNSLDPFSSETWRTSFGTFVVQVYKQWLFSVTCLHFWRIFSLEIKFYSFSFDHFKDVNLLSLIFITSTEGSSLLHFWRLLAFSLELFLNFFLWFFHFPKGRYE